MEQTYSLPKLGLFLFWSAGHRSPCEGIIRKSWGRGTTDTVVDVVEVRTTFTDMTLSSIAQNGQTHFIGKAVHKVTHDEGNCQSNLLTTLLLIMPAVGGTSYISTEEQWTTPGCPQGIQNSIFLSLLARCLY